MNQELIKKVLTKLLPITEDIEEAEALHQLLLQEILNKNQILMNNM